MTDHRPGTPGDDPLSDLLHSPLDAGPGPGDRRRRTLLVAAAVGVIAVIAGVSVLLLKGRDPGPAATTAAGAQADADGDLDTGRTSAPGAISTTAVTGPTLPGSLGYPESRVLAVSAGGGPGLMVMFGGADPGGSVVDDVIADTWIYAFAEDAWYQIEGVGPLARLDPSFAYDTQSEVVVLFGGATGRPNYCRVVRRCAPEETSEVWWFSPETGIWDRQTATDGPPARFGAVAGYDAGSDRIVIFGGARTLDTNAAVEMFQDTWAYDFDTNTWTEMNPAASPPARAHAAMAYDPAGDRLLLFGGSGRDEEMDATVWAYDLEADAWTPLPVVGDQPDATWDPTFVYADSIGAPVLVGGEGPLTREIAEGVTATEVGWTERVWVLDAATGAWSEVEPFPGPVAGHAAAWDPISERMVVYALGYTLLYDPAADVWENLTPEE